MEGTKTSNCIRKVMGSPQTRIKYTIVSQERDETAQQQKSHTCWTWLGGDLPVKHMSFPISYWSPSTFYYRYQREKVIGLSSSKILHEQQAVERYILENDIGYICFHLLSNANVTGSYEPQFHNVIGWKHSICFRSSSWNTESILSSR